MSKANTSRRKGLAAILATLPLFVAAQATLASSALAAVSGWTYQLQQVDLPTLAADGAELVVIDYSRNGTDAQTFTAADIAALKTAPDGSARTVLAYLSIGEAESYRFYWQRGWFSQPPQWLGAENPDWDANFAVRYWDPQWRAILFGGPSSYLDQIIGAGFDGVYLDRVDAFEVPDRTLGSADRFDAMVDLVTDLSAYARARARGFLIVPQNGEELLADATYRAAIDGLGKEDLLFGIEDDGVRNTTGDIRASLSLLTALIAEGKPVFLVEYLDTAEDIAAARADAQTLQMPLFIASRELDDAHSR